MLYSAADSFNPYTAKTDINRQLCQLIFEPLLVLDNEFKPEYKIASSVEIKDTTCTVKIKSTRFSDGSILTAEDVVYSCNLARNTAGKYAASLYEVASVSAADSNTVIFKMTKQDPYFANLLTFPILKKGSEKITDSDSVAKPPIGSGRYKVSKDETSLELNENFGGKVGSIKKINLINAPDTDSVSHYLEIGAADIYFSRISDGNIHRMSGKKLDVNLNSIIYIGINHNNSLLAQNELRQALSSAISRKKIVESAYYNNALSATGFFNPLWNETKSVQNIQIESKSEITVENLEKIGYNRLDNKNNRINASGFKLELSLLVNSDNRLKVSAARMIASELKEHGININVVEKSYAAYTDALKKGNFQLYLGEVLLTDNMDISCMIEPGGSAAYGIKKPAETNDKKPETEKENKEQGEASKEQAVTNTSAEVLNGFYSGKNTLSDLATVLQTEMPFIPICYRTGVLFYNEKIENLSNSSASDIYTSIESYIFNN
ncbi:MAG: hypothetical protein IKT38_02935 [Clostridia bacterium]|nr:hypothetical protein [Clostridia bacterium]